MSNILPHQRLTNEHAIILSVCVASIVRIHYLSVFSSTLDITYVMGPVFIWSSVEPSVGIFSACLPTLPPLVQFIIRDKKEDSTDAGYYYSSASKHLPVGTWRNRRAAKASQQADDRVFLHVADEECELTSYIRSGVDINNTGTAGQQDDRVDNAAAHANGIRVESSIEQSNARRASPLSFSSKDFRG